jgi:2-oxoglutarate ferredoxin oxidoreductase subunit gamma
VSGEHEVIFAGEGGQGLVVTGTLLGTAAAVHEDRFAAQTVDYGIASRGGFVMAEVKVSDSEIDCPELTEPEYIVTLTEEAYERLKHHADHGTVVYDSDVVEDQEPVEGAVGYPLTTRLRELAAEYGDVARVNTLALGVVLGLEQLVSVEAMREAFRSEFGSDAVEVNMEVLRAGMELAGS